MVKVRRRRLSWIGFAVHRPGRPAVQAVNVQHGGKLQGRDARRRPRAGSGSRWRLSPGTIAGTITAVRVMSGASVVAHGVRDNQRRKPGWSELDRWRGPCRHRPEPSAQADRTPARWARRSRAAYPRSPSSEEPPSFIDTIPETGAGMVTRQAGRQAGRLTGRFFPTAGAFHSRANPEHLTLTSPDATTGKPRGRFAGPEYPPATHDGDAPKSCLILTACSGARGYRGTVSGIGGAFERKSAASDACRRPLRNRQLPRRTFAGVREIHALPQFRGRLCARPVISTGAT